MSDHTQTTANAPTDPVLCKMGCGFFGNGAMGGCCSKCYRDMMKKEECKVVEKVKESAPPVPMEENVPMDVEPNVVAAAVPDQKPSPLEAAAAGEAPASTTPKKKKKKASYKDMMQGVMKTATPDVDAKEKQKEQLLKVTGGGAFSKIDKI